MSCFLCSSVRCAVPKDVWAAAAAGRWAYVVKEMEENPGIVHTADIGGQTMLHWAALHGANVLVQRLLDMGASVRHWASVVEVVAGVLPMGGLWCCS